MSGMPHASLAASSRDPDAYASAVHNCQVRILSTGRGVFEAKMVLARLPDLSLFLASETVLRRAILSLAPDRVFFGIRPEGDPPTMTGSAEG